MWTTELLFELNNNMDKTPVILTDKAKEYMTSVADGGYVTLGVKGGGCSGLTYIWGKSETAKDPSEKIKWSEPVEGVLLLDPMSEIYVMGSQIDYVEELGGSYLNISNPMQTSSCGCGASFSV